MTTRGSIASVLHSDNEQGVVTLLAVLLIGAIGGAISIALLMNATSWTRIALITEQSTRAGAHATTCAEIALNKLAQNLSYAGNETIVLGTESCTIGTLQDSSGQKIIPVTGSAGPVTRKVRIQTQTLQPQITIASWADVADF